MTLGVWLVPVVLLAVIMLLWASAWFEGYVAPREHDRQLRPLEELETAISDAATSDAATDNTSLMVVDEMPSPEPSRSAA